MTDDDGADQPLDSAAIVQYVTEVADVLPAAADRRVLVVVGGALLAWRGLRSATRDVDSARRLDDEVRAAVQQVAARHHLAPRWLNDSAAGFIPATFSEADCEILLEHPAMLVLGAPLERVFVMKLFAGPPPMSLTSRPCGRGATSRRRRPLPRPSTPPTHTSRATHIWRTGSATSRRRRSESRDVPGCSDRDVAGQRVAR